MPNPDAIERLHALASGPPDQGATADGYATSEAVAPEKRWPFVESPGQFAARLGLAYDRAHHAIAHDNFLAAVRTVLIEEPPTLAPHVRSAAIAEMAEGLERMSARAAKLEAVYAALRAAFPHFEDGAPIEPEAIEKIGREYQSMTFASPPKSIDFVDDEGTPGKLTWAEGDSSVGVQSGWAFDGVIVEGARYDAIVHAMTLARAALGRIGADAETSLRLNVRKFSDEQLATARDAYTALNSVIPADPKPPERPILANQTDAVTASLLGIGHAWSAYRAGSVLGDSVGWGATREAAEADLRAKEELL